MGRNRLCYFRPIVPWVGYAWAAAQGRIYFALAKGGVLGEVARKKMGERRRIDSVFYGIIRQNEMASLCKRRLK